MSIITFIKNDPSQSAELSILFWPTSREMGGDFESGLLPGGNQSKHQQSPTAQTAPSCLASFYVREFEAPLFVNAVREFWRRAEAVRVSSKERKRVGVK